MSQPNPPAVPACGPAAARSSFPAPTPPASPTPASPTPAPPTPEGRWLSHWFTRVRREGLLTALTPEQWHTLSAVLSFRSQAGPLTFTADQLSLVLGRPREEALRRLEVLGEFRWRGTFLVRPDYYLNGELAGVTVADLELFSLLAAGPIPAASVSAPRTVNPERRLTPELGVLARELEDVGVTPGQAEWLLSRFTPDRIQRQLVWLPDRAPRNPAALLIRAVEEDWEPPRGREEPAGAGKTPASGEGPASGDASPSTPETAGDTAYGEEAP